jgi:hypothetical protein
MAGGPPPEEFPPPSPLILGLAVVAALLIYYFAYCATDLYLTARGLPPGGLGTGPWGRASVRWVAALQSIALAAPAGAVLVGVCGAALFKKTHLLVASTGALLGSVLLFQIVGQSLAISAHLDSGDHQLDTGGAVPRNLRVATWLACLSWVWAAYGTAVVCGVIWSRWGGEGCK